VCVRVTRASSVTLNPRQVLSALPFLTHRGHLCVRVCDTCIFSHFQPSTGSVCPALPYSSKLPNISTNASLQCEGQSSLHQGQSLAMSPFSDRTPYPNAPVHPFLSSVPAAQLFASPTSPDPRVRSSCLSPSSHLAGLPHQVILLVSLVDAQLAGVVQAPGHDVA